MKRWFISRNHNNGSPCFSLPDGCPAVWAHPSPPSLGAPFLLSCFLDLIAALFMEHIYLQFIEGDTRGVNCLRCVFLKTVFFSLHIWQTVGLGMETWLGNQFPLELRRRCSVAGFHVSVLKAGTTASPSFKHVHCCTTIKIQTWSVTMKISLLLPFKAKPIQPLSPPPAIIPSSWQLTFCLLSMQFYHVWNTA